jgi:hypothetical protein
MIMIAVIVDVIKAWEVFDDVIELLVHVSEQTEYAVEHIGLAEHGDAG